MPSPDTQASLRDAKTIAQAALSKLRMRVRMSWFVILCERFVQSFWHTGVLLLIALTAVFLHLHDLLPANILYAAIGLYIACVLYSLKTGFGEFKVPTQPDAINRLDIGLDERPLSGLSDRLALGEGDEQAEYLWALHLENLAQKAQKASVAHPDIRLSLRDPWATRLVVLLLFMTTLFFAKSDIASGLISNGSNGEARATGPSFEAWAQPPLYTAKPTIYLNDVSENTLLSIPTNSEITLRIYGVTGDEKIEESISLLGNTEIPATDQDVLQLNIIVKKSGVMRVLSDSGDWYKWRINALADNPPTINFTKEVSRSIQGEMEIPFSAADDYGVTGGRLSAKLDIENTPRKYGLALNPEYQPPLNIDIPLPFNSDTTLFEDVLVDNQAKHPWAGLPVVMSLHASDAAQNNGQSEPLETNLPGKRFFDALAKGLVDVRRELLWNRTNADRAIYVIKAITYRPEGLFPDEKAYLMVRTALRRMEYNQPNPMSDEMLTEVTDLLWNAALLIEDGDLDDAKERLRRAQERLNEAMENGATKDEIEQLMQELRDATKDYIAQLERRQSDDMQQSNNQSQTITQDQLRQMMDEIQDLMEQGRMEEAQALMEQLQNLLENMRTVEVTPGQGGEQDEEMQDTLREQQELADDTFRELQEEFDRQSRQNQQQQQGQQNGQQQSQQPGQQEGQQSQQGQQGQQQGNQQGDQQGGQQQGNQQSNQEGNQQGDQFGNQQGQNQNGQGGSGNKQSDLAGRQEALRQMLDQQRRNAPNNGSEEGEAARRALERAEREMGEAGQDLEDGDIAGALDNQSDAIEALREGMRHLRDQQRQAQGGQEGFENEGQAQSNQQTTGRSGQDPLGRDTSGQGSQNDARNGQLNAEREQRQNKILDEIKRRSNDRTRPNIELDYLDRLLERF